MYMPLIRAEIFRLSRRLMPKVLLLILVIGVAGLYGLLLLTLRASTEGVSAENLADLRESLRVEAARDTGLGLVQTIGTVLVIILAVSTISSEYGWGTIRVLLPRAGSRPAVLTAKLVLLLLFTLVAVVLGYLVALAGSYAVSLAEDLSTRLGGSFLPESIAAIGRTAYVMLPYLALGFFIAVLTRSTAAGIAITLSVFFLEGIAVTLIDGLGDPYDRIPDVLLTRNVSAVMAANRVPSDDLTRDPSALPNAWQGAAVLAVYIAAFIALSYQRFVSRDVTAS
jgi:ABC-2 type transport system permease protein